MRVICCRGNETGIVFWQGVFSLSPFFWMSVYWDNVSVFATAVAICQRHHIWSTSCFRWWHSSVRDQIPPREESTFSSFEDCHICTATTNNNCWITGSRPKASRCAMQWNYTVIRTKPVQPQQPVWMNCSIILEWCLLLWYNKSHQRNIPVRKHTQP